MTSTANPEGKHTLMSGGGKNGNIKLVRNVNVTDKTLVSTWGWQSISAVPSGSRNCFLSPGPYVYLLLLHGLFLKIAPGKMGLTENMD